MNCSGTVSISELRAPGATVTLTYGSCSIKNNTTVVQIIWHYKMAYKTYNIMMDAIIIHTCLTSSIYFFQFINQTMYKSFDKLVCTGTTTITYIQRHNTRYVKIYKDEFTVMIYM